MPQLRPPATTDLRQAYDHAKAAGEACALVLVTHTQGSTYARLGSRMLIGASGWSVGLVGGGCFDQELIITAQHCLTSGSTAALHFDMRRPDDGILGSGLGCEGMTQVWIGPVALLLQHHPIDAVIPAQYIPATSQISLQLSLADRSSNCFTEQLLATRRLLVLGHGEDVIPLVQVAHALRWQVHVIAPKALKPMVAAMCAVAQVHHQTLQVFLKTTVSRQADAIVLMNHDLAADALSLEAAARSEAGYIGLLGPAHRRDRLLSMIDQRLRSTLQPRLFAPCGKRLIAKDPAVIALGICAEIAEVFRINPEQESSTTASVR